MTRSLKKMTKLVLAAWMGVLIVCTSGCYKYVAEHSEKSEAQFYEDQAECEKIARAYSMERVQEYREGNEIDQSRRCMRDRGWKYHFRK
jgi:hypothetical protein